jgi:hypothetical protein
MTRLTRGFLQALRVRPVRSALLLLATLAACRGAGEATGEGAAAARAPAPNRFASDRLWDDGKAEIDAYEAKEERYGIPRPFTAYMIVVKEDFSRSQLVKADPGHDPRDLMPVLKLNRVHHLQTGIYAYHQMASSFFERATMDLVKFTLTSFEWCGNSFKEYTRRDGRASLEVHTYWDGQADATYAIPAGPDVILYDQLPLWIRSLPQEPGTVEGFRLVPGQIDSRGAKPDLRRATLRALSEGPLKTPAGSFRALLWELSVGDARPDRFWTDRRFPYLLLAWEKPDGGSYRLAWTRRLAYWTLNHPGDESFLEAPRRAAGAGRSAGRRPPRP